MRQVKVNGYSAGWLKKGFPWVYPKEIVGKRPPEGSFVEIVNVQGDFLGVGVSCPGFVAVRRFRTTRGALDEACVHQLMSAAYALREVLIDVDTTGYRLVNAENDGLPGIRVDWWSHVASIILDNPALHKLVPHIESWLKKHLNPRTVVLSYRPDSRDKSVMKTIKLAPGLISGRPPTGPVTVLERGMKLLTWPLEAPDVGVYADMREVRRWMEPFWGATTVLNTFAFTGAFSVAAALGGASDVVTVDLSRKYLDRARENFTANDLDHTGYTFTEADVFKALDRLRRTQAKFDRIIVDPPSFSHSDEGVWSAKRDWPRLVAAAVRVCEPGGWLILASNQGVLSPKAFTGLISDGLKRAGRSAQLLASFGQGPDFPAATSFPEGRYLKVYIYRVI